MILNKTYEIKKVMVDDASLIKIVEWNVTFTDPDDVSESTKHTVKTRFDTPSLDYTVLSTDELQAELIEVEGGEKFINQLEEFSSETILNNKFEKNSIIAYDTTEKVEQESSHNVSSFEGLIVWELFFEQGQVREDQFPTPSSVFYDLVEEGQFITKPQITFIKSGSFHLETAAGRKYFLDATTPPRLWHPAINFKWTALEPDSKIICIKNKSKDPMIQYDTERLLPPKGETVVVGGLTETVVYIVAGEFEDSVKNKLGTGFKKRLLAGESFTLLSTKDGGNVIVASNPRPYEFEVTTAEPEAFTLAAVGA